MVKKESGITLIILVITVLILMIIAGVIVSSGVNNAKTATRENLKTNMMLIKVKGIECVENTNFSLGTVERSDEEKQAIKNEHLIGQKTTEPLPVELGEGDEAYQLTSQNMQDLGLGELSDTSSDYVIVYNIGEEGVDVIYKPGITENNQKYYSLADMEEARTMKEKELERLTKLKEIENYIHNEEKLKYVCGIDEAGRGPLAGPVVVASVIMPENSMIEGVNDSKKVSEKKRERLFEVIKNEALTYGIGISWQEEIDEINILQATKVALTRSLEQLKIKPNVILVDALRDINTLGVPYRSLIKGDAKVYSISAASILAKVTRDRIMREFDEIYPEYNFAKHKGYGTAKHIEAIRTYGLCPIHRKSFTKKFV